MSLCTQINEERPSSLFSLWWMSVCMCEGLEAHTGSEKEYRKEEVCINVPLFHVTLWWWFVVSWLSPSCLFHGLVSCQGPAWYGLSLLSGVVFLDKDPSPFFLVLLQPWGSCPCASLKEGSEGDKEHGLWARDCLATLGSSCPGPGANLSLLPSQSSLLASYRQWKYVAYSSGKSRIKALASGKDFEMELILSPHTADGDGGGWGSLLLDIF